MSIISAILHRYYRIYPPLSTYINPVFIIFQSVIIIASEKLPCDNDHIIIDFSSLSSNAVNYLFKYKLNELELLTKQKPRESYEKDTSGMW